MGGLVRDGRWRTAAIAVRVLLVVLVAVIALRPDLPGLAEKAMTARLIGYPLATLLLPVGWAVAARRRPTGLARPPYPWLADLLLTAPFALDLLGNVLNLFDTVPPFDDWMHFQNWLLLSGGVGALLARSAAVRQMPPAAVFALVLAFGAAAAILWEGLEWYGFIRFGTELDTAYEDTLLDQHLGLLGSAIAAVVTARFVGRSRS